MARVSLDCDTYACPYNISPECRYDTGIVQIRDGKCRTYEEVLHEVEVEAGFEIFLGEFQETSLESRTSKEIE